MTTVIALLAAYSVFSSLVLVLLCYLFLGFVRKTEKALHRHATVLSVEQVRRYESVNGRDYGKQESAA
jgi:hypothetical protein